jgi:peptide/nickel transport system permease protein
MTLRSFLVKRLLYTVLLIFMVIIVNWLIFEGIPGQNGAQALLSSSPRLSQDPGAMARVCAQWNCHASRTDQFIAYLHSMLTFQFGVSYQNGLPIATQIIQQGRLQNTLLLLGVSTILAILLGIVLGVVASNKRGSVMDGLTVTSSIATTSLPTFWVGLLFILVFAIGLGWFPSGGIQPASWTIPGNLPNPLMQFLIRCQFLFLPALTLTLISYGSFVLLTRATMMESLTEDYILTAKAKGLKQRTILFRHAFKNASLPVITASALAFGGILAGAIITETVFAWPGLGFWLYQAVEVKDYPVMQAMFYLISLTVIAANFISDVLYGVIDPRIRYE